MRIVRFWSLVSVPRRMDGFWLSDLRRKARTSALPAVFGLFSIVGSWEDWSAAAHGRVIDTAVKSYISYIPTAEPVLCNDHHLAICYTLQVKDLI